MANRPSPNVDTVTVKELDRLLSEYLAGKEDRVQEAAMQYSREHYARTTGLLPDDLSPEAFQDMAGTFGLLASTMRLRIMWALAEEAVGEASKSTAHRRPMIGLGGRAGCGRSTRLGAVWCSRGGDLPPHSPGCGC